MKQKSESKREEENFKGKEAITERIKILTHHFREVIANRLKKKISGLKRNLNGERMKNLQE